DGAQLVEIERNQHHRGAGIARLAKGIVDAAGGVDVEAAGGLDSDHQPRRLRSAGELAAGDELLLVAAGKIGGARQRVGRAHVERGDQLGGAAAAPVAIDAQAPRIWRRAVVAEGEVLLDREGKAERAAVAVFGEMDGAGGARGAGIPRPALGSAGELERAAERSQTGERFGELGLAVSVDAGDAEDLAARDAQGEAAQRRAAAVGKARDLSCLEKNVGPTR